jgi:RNA polymerase sigma factor (sigma-70 family)
MAEQDASASAARHFATTHWSVVLAASDGDSPAATEALERLCRTYWYPLYAFLRRKGYPPSDAEDLVQGFLLQVVAGRGLKDVEQGHGRFRSYLLGALRHFLANEWDKARAEKRGGGVALLSLEELGPENRYSRDLADDSTPETLYERTWAATVLERVHRWLRREYRDNGKENRFDIFEGYLMSESKGLTYAEAGARLGIAEGTVKAEVHRLRKRYRSLLRAEIAHTVKSPEDISEEIRLLIAAISG